MNDIYAHTDGSRDYRPVVGEGAWAIPTADSAAPALDRQVGGDHYKKLAIQPMSYGMMNHLDPLQFSVVKYVTRFRDKGGIPDLEKAKHCLDMLIEHEAARPTF